MDNLDLNLPYNMTDSWDQDFYLHPDYFSLYDDFNTTAESPADMFPDTVESYHSSPSDPQLQARASSYDNIAPQPYYTNSIELNPTSQLDNSTISEFAEIAKKRKPTTTVDDRIIIKLQKLINKDKTLSVQNLSDLIRKKTKQKISKKYIYKLINNGVLHGYVKKSNQHSASKIKERTKNFNLAEAERTNSIDITLRGQKGRSWTRLDSETIAKIQKIINKDERLTISQIAIKASNKTGQKITKDRVRRLINKGALYGYVKKNSHNKLISPTYIDTETIAKIQKIIDKNENLTMADIAKEATNLTGLKINRYRILRLIKKGSLQGYVNKGPTRSKQTKQKVSSTKPTEKKARIKVKSRTCLDSETISKIQTLIDNDKSLTMDGLARKISKKVNQNISAYKVRKLINNGTLHGYIKKNYQLREPVVEKERRTSKNQSIVAEPSIDITYSEQVEPAYDSLVNHQQSSGFYKAHNLQLDVQVPDTTPTIDQNLSLNTNGRIRIQEIPYTRPYKLSGPINYIPQQTLLEPIKQFPIRSGTITNVQPVEIPVNLGPLASPTDIFGINENKSLRLGRITVHSRSSEAIAQNIISKKLYKLNTGEPPQLKAPTERHPTSLPISLLAQNRRRLKTIQRQMERQQQLEQNQYSYLNRAYQPHQDHFQHRIQMHPGHRPHLANEMDLSTRDVYQMQRPISVQRDPSFQDHLYPQQLPNAFHQRSNQHLVQNMPSNRPHLTNEMDLSTRGVYQMHPPISVQRDPRFQGHLFPQQLPNAFHQESNQYLVQNMPSNRPHLTNEMDLSTRDVYQMQPPLVVQRDPSFQGHLPQDLLPNQFDQGPVQRGVQLIPINEPLLSNAMDLSRRDTYQVQKPIMDHREPRLQSQQTQNYDNYHHINSRYNSYQEPMHNLQNMDPRYSAVYQPHDQQPHEHPSSQNYYNG